MLECYVDGWRDQEMDMFGHQNERMQLVVAFAAISVERLQEQADVIFDNEKPSPLPC
jgi:hypothetical protein